MDFPLCTLPVNGLSGVLNNKNPNGSFPNQSLPKLPSQPLDNFLHFTALLLLLLLSQRCAGNTLCWQRVLWLVSGNINTKIARPLSSTSTDLICSSESSWWALLVRAKDPFPGVKGCWEASVGVNGAEWGIIMDVNWDVDRRAFCEAELVCQLLCLRPLYLRHCWLKCRNWYIQRFHFQSLKSPLGDCLSGLVSFGSAVLCWDLFQDFSCNWHNEGVIEETKANPICHWVSSLFLLCPAFKCGPLEEL